MTGLALVRLNRKICKNFITFAKSKIHVSANRRLCPHGLWLHLWTHTRVCIRGTVSLRKNQQISSHNSTPERETSRNSCIFSLWETTTAGSFVFWDHRRREQAPKRPRILSKKGSNREKQQASRNFVVVAVSCDGKKTHRRSGRAQKTKRDVFVATTKTPHTEECRVAER